MAKTRDPQLTILDPPANCAVGPDFSVFGTCDAGQGLTVTVNITDGAGGTHSGTGQVDSAETWSVSFTGIPEGQLTNLTASVTGYVSPSVSGVQVQLTGIITLPNNSGIGIDFTAQGVCEALAQDPNLIPQVKLTLE